MINNSNYIRKIKISDLMCVLITALQLDLFYLLDTEFKLGQAILLIISVLYIIKYLKKRIDRRDVNLYIILFLSVLVLTGAYQVSHIFGGGIFPAFLAERVLWVYIIFYFALEKLFAMSKLTNEKCLKYLRIVGLIQLVLYFTQWVLSSRYIFLHVLSGSRYGSARFYFQPILLIILLCFCVSDFFNQNKHKANIIWILMIFLEILVVQKYRMTIVAITLAILCGFLLYRGNLSKGLGIIALGIIAFIVLLNTPMGQDIMNSLFGNASDNGLRGRAAWRIWAVEQLKQNPLLGNGFVYSAESYNYGGQYVRQHFGWSFTPGDYGIMGFIYEYGLLGADWFIFFAITQLRRALYVWKHKKNYAYIIFLAFILIDSYSELYWILSNGLFVLVLYMIMLKYECLSINKTRLQFTE